MKKVFALVWVLFLIFGIFVSTAYAVDGLDLEELSTAVEEWSEGKASTRVVKIQNNLYMKIEVEGEEPEILCKVYEYVTEDDDAFWYVEYGEVSERITFLQDNIPGWEDKFPAWIE